MNPQPAQGTLLAKRIISETHEAWREIEDYLVCNDYRGANARNDRWEETIEEICEEELTKK